MEYAFGVGVGAGFGVGHVAGAVGIESADYVARGPEQAHGAAGAVVEVRVVDGGATL